MITVALNALGGALTAYVDVLPFQTAPDVIVWGSRVFMNSHAYDDDGRPIYAEAFAAYAVPVGQFKRIDV